MELSVSEAKRNICNVLGDEASESYFALLKNWFRGELTRDDFDTEARKLFSNNSVHIHNHFLLALFSKCSLNMDDIDQRRTTDSVDKSAGRRKRKSSNDQLEEKRKRFAAVYVTDPQVSDEFLPQFDPQDFLDIPTCSHEGVIPGPEIVEVRAMVGAVEQDLEHVSRDAVSVVLLGVYDILKNIIIEMLKLRKPHSLRCGKFPHKFGYKQLQSKPEISGTASGGSGDQASERNDQMNSTTELKDPAIAYTSLVLPNESISLTDLMHVLAPPHGPSVLPVHSIWLAAFERTMNSMHQEGRMESMGYQAGLDWDKSDAAARSGKMAGNI